MEQLE